MKAKDYYVPDRGRPSRHLIQNEILPHSVILPSTDLGLGVTTLCGTRFGRDFSNSWLGNTAFLLSTLVIHFSSLFLARA